MNPSAKATTEELYEAYRNEAESHDRWDSETQPSPYHPLDWVSRLARRPDVVPLLFRDLRGNTFVEWALRVLHQLPPERLSADTADVVAELIKRTPMSRPHPGMDTVEAAKLLFRRYPERAKAMQLHRDLRFCCECAQTLAAGPRAEHIAALMDDTDPRVVERMLKCVKASPVDVMGNDVRLLLPAAKLREIGRAHV